METTIAAISTPNAAGGIGIVRISGPQAHEVAGRIFYPVNRRPVEGMKGYTCAYGDIRDGAGKIDEGILTIFRGPRSYTGEDTAEVSCHGGIAVTRRVLRAALENGAVPAGPGEFTKRAYLNGKMELTQAEAVMDLIGAATDQAARAALSCREGVLGRATGKSAEALISLSGHLAAWVDYPEEEIEELELSALETSLKGQKAELERLLSTYDQGRILREGISAVIAGKPNVGKSTLMNLLAGFQRSIVADIPGTTRDVVEDTVRIGDYLLRIADTAGLRETADPVESAGVALSQERIQTGDLILAVFDSSSALSQEDLDLMEASKGRPAIAVVNKSDLEPRLELPRLREVFHEVVVLSAKDGTGAEGLTSAIRRTLHLTQLQPGEAFLSHERQRDCTARACQAVGEALEAVQGGMTLDAVSVCIDGAIAALMELTGKQVSEAVVNEVFAKFCVGK